MIRPFFLVIRYWIQGTKNNNNINNDDDDDDNNNNNPPRPGNTGLMSTGG